ncbi:DUF924 domain-containing protein [Limibaculum sp. FT325]|uniref:DUF924 family protein n=1 Tax=Thermohalobaculum sediminis TaxID=2939436 RepID=UPI0020BF5BE9|nr:DUF924 family protein [Limibaculum sediminis]MCL5778495.1 DUF924 domain-containing protein [Limibaculum sediminis]
MIPDRTRATAEILDFWLGEIGPGKWYVADPGLDAAIARRFASLWHEALRDPPESWLCTARGALAHLVLLDQFPRNMFGGTARAYASDQRARARAKRAIDLGRDLSMPEPERQFFYLPLMHSESLSDQELCIALLRQRMPLTGANNLGHAVRHRDVIRRFGRFPSRNAALGRRDTEREIAYRAGGGYMS